MMMSNIENIFEYKSVYKVSITEFAIHRGKSEFKTISK